MRSSSRASPVTNAGSACPRQDRKCRLEIVLGWKVVEWKVVLPGRFQWSYRDFLAVKALKGTSGLTNDSSKPPPSGAPSARRPLFPPPPPSGERGLFSCPPPPWGERGWG